MRSRKHWQTARPVLHVDDDIKLLIRIIGARRGRAQSENLARSLISKFSDIGTILRADPSELECIPGFDKDIAEEFAATRDLIFALARRPLEKRAVFDDPEAVISFCQILLANEKREQFHALFLNKDFRLIVHKCLQIGTVDHVTVYPREVMFQALTCHACSVILVHNHPSGNEQPSRADIEITAELVKVGRYLGISISDHIIVGGGQGFSFLQNGIMPAITQD
jgi:DNA repair protein RadC